MKVEFSKAFIKASKRLSGKMLDSLRRTSSNILLHEAKPMEKR